ncbi:MAG: SDR family oxidoreductase [Geminicoccaceae bacterium]|nr:SDR family oxidoreductase [Geminicoccaceae bacterium]
MVVASGKKAVVVGGMGVIGRNLLRWLERNTDWQLVGLSRRPPDFPTRARFVSVDLLDRDQAEEKLAGLDDVTHVFYAAFQQAETWAGHDAPNLALLRNSVEPIAAVSKVLEHVHLVEGTKIYGSHLGPFKTPAKESDPPHMLPNFYHTQETWLRRFRQGKPWSFSALRPQTVCGIAFGNPMNLVVGLAVYAAISKELGLPLRYPGSEKAYRSLYQVTDSELLAACMHWCATSPAARDEVFNITNTDYFRWEHVWPGFAEAFGMKPGGVQTIRLAEFMADKAELWASMQKKYDLRPIPWKELVAWPFVDYCLTRDYDVMTDTIKIRKAGFHLCEDSEAMFARLFAELRAMRVIP